VGHAVGSAASSTFEVIKGGADAVIDGVEDVGRTVEHAAEDVVKETGGFLKKAVKYVGGELSAAATGVWDAVKDVGAGVVGCIEDVGKGLVGGIGGFVVNLVQLKVGDAFDSLIQGADRAFLQAPQRLLNGLLDGANDFVDGASHLLGPLGVPARWVADRGFDIARTAGNTCCELARDVFRLPFDTAVTLGRGLWASVHDLVHGRIGKAFKDFGMAFVNAGGRAVGGVADMAARSAQSAPTITLLAGGMQPPSRKLTDDEKNLLREVYGDSVDLDAVRVSVGGPLNNAMDPHTVGNTIYLPSDQTGPVTDAAGNLTAAGSLLIHESGHVWQSQNGGGDYISQAVFPQAVAKLQGQDRGVAYDYNSAIRDGKSFSQLNPEQQAEYVERVLGPILAKPGDAEANLAAAGLGPADLAYAEDALHHIRAGTGAA
jgi:hypothetical protein